MVFSSAIFLYGFLPAVLAAYFLTPRALKNLTLLVASLLFYTWGEVPWMMLASIAINYGLGLWVERARSPRAAKLVVALCVVVNLSLLIVFKYANFGVQNYNEIAATLGLSAIHLKRIALPLGISFFTFHAMSYVIDIYRKQARAMRNPLNMALYIAFFPQLIAGPIIRYHEIADQFARHGVTLERFAAGVRRFVVGLAKKVLIANTVGAVADQVFAVPLSELTPGVAWLGVVCYSLQIYFDFSGYSDMAIGLARLFGFVFPENFNYPYVSRSITEFWRRWHMTLSRWFRDYVYIPLGGNRVAPWRTYVNLVIVFVLCGLWHGASWNFLIWGLYYGVFLVVERLLNLGADRPAGGVVLGRVYVLLVVMVGWVFFRAESFAQSSAFLRAMVGFEPDDVPEFGVRAYLSHEVMLVLLAGVIGSTPWWPTLRVWFNAVTDPNRPATRLSPWAAALVPMARTTLILLMLFAVAAKLAAGTHNPFIYFRF